MRRPPESLQVVALGLIQGAAELLPVSSSAHVAAVPQLLRLGGRGRGRRRGARSSRSRCTSARWSRSRRRCGGCGRTRARSRCRWRRRWSWATLFERPIEERLGGPAGLASGLLLGAAALAAADRRGGLRATHEGLWTVERSVAALALGLAQAAALWPGVSRTGATLAAARALGYSRAEASRLSFGVAGPVLAGATALKAWRGRHARGPQRLLAHRARSPRSRARARR